MAKQGNKTEKQICTDLNFHMFMFQIGSATQIQQISWIISSFRLVV